MFRCIPLFRGCNRQVEYIDKRHCGLANVPDDVLRYPRTLEELLLDSNHIRDVPKGLFRLIKLRRLTLSDNEIGRLPPDIASLVNLVEFDISKNDIPDIPENIKFLKSLQNLDISSNPLSKLPAGFVQLRNLTVLGLNDVSLSQLPSDFGNLQNLQSLELRENILRTLPPSFAMLTKLERLDLGNNEISELPPLIGQLSNLQELWLDCNELYTLPVEIENLKKLACLDVSENRLEYLPEEIGGLSSLTDLHLSQNCLESLPDGIGKLLKLTIFKIDQNRLLSLTPEIGKCVSLQELILTENLISELPQSIGNLVNLTNLNVDRNHLSEIPPQIGNLVRLGVLSLRENRLNFLPEELGMLKELHVLDVSGNRLQYLPITITALNLKALWLAENQSQPMLKFQTDINERTGAKVLTCFLLPQQEYHPESMENLLRDSIEQDSRLSWDQRGERTSSVKFVEENDEEKEDKETQFVRHDTPHPRELKARHNKLLVSKSKNIDGHVVTHEEKENDGVDSFRPQRSSITSVTSSSSETSATQFKDAVQSLADIPDSDDQPENTTEEAVTATEMTEVNHHLYRAQTREDLLDEDDNDSGDSSEQELEKRVGFDPDAESQPEKHNKLHRRDTPHHLKNKRINLIDSQKDHEKVLAILAQEAKKESCEDSASQQSFPSSHVSAVSDTDKNDTLSSGISSPTNMEMIETEIQFIVQKTASGLGLSIAGGVGSTPYKGEDEGIFVSKVISDGPAEKAGLKTGDKIVSVNGKMLNGVTHYDAVDALKTAGNELIIAVLRETAKVYEEHSAGALQTRIVPESVSVKADHDVSEASTITYTPNEDLVKTERALPSQEANIHPVQSTVKIDKTDLNSPKNIELIQHVNKREEIVDNPVTKAEPVQNVPNKMEPLVNSLPKVSQPVYKSKKPENLNIKVPEENQEVIVNHLPTESPTVKTLPSTEYDIKSEIFHTTLIREQNGLGLSIAGNPAGGDLVDGHEGIYITKIAETGAAAKDGKLKVGDKILTINGVDMEGARHDQAVAMLSGLDRFIRLVVQRQKLVPRDPSAPHRLEKSSISSSSSSVLGQKSPKLIGLPRPYTQKFYSTGSYMANRPSYMGSYRRPEISPISTDTKPTFNLYTKLPGLRYEPLNIQNVNSVTSEKSSNPAFNSALNSLPNMSVKTNTVQGVSMCQKQNEQNSSAYVETNCINHINFKGEVEEVSLIKAGGPLGLSIIGGVDHTCHPFGANEPGIFISKIVPEGAAAKTGKLKVGDRLLKVNDADVREATHKDAVMALLAPTYQMTLTVRHDPLPKGWQEIVIRKHPSEKLGMGIQGGVGGQSGNPNDKDDEGIFISWVNSDGASGADGRLKPGMRIIEVNEFSLLGATYQEAITALRTACDSVHLTVCDGYNSVDEIEEPQMLKLTVSSSSIDKDDEMSRVFRQEHEVKEETALWEKEDLESRELLREQQRSPNSDKFFSEEYVMKHRENGFPSDNSHIESNEIISSTPVKDMKNNIDYTETLVSHGMANYLQSPPSPIHFTSENLDVTASSDGSSLDPIGKAKLPGAKPLPAKPTKPPVVATSEPEQLTFSEKKRRFEQVFKQPSDKMSADIKQFSYFTEQELERMREEEEKKLASMTEEQIKVYHSLDEEDDAIHEIVKNENALSEISTHISSSSTSTSMHEIPVRTAKAEKRLQAKLQKENSEQEYNLSNLTPLQQRALQAEKHAAWRQARLKSLEADVLQAQLVIAKARELAEAKFRESQEERNDSASDHDDSGDAESSNSSDNIFNNVQNSFEENKEYLAENGMVNIEDD